jgi:hypothetical protein
VAGILAFSIAMSALLPGESRAQAGSASGNASAAFWEAVERDDVKAVQTEMLRGSSANARHPQHGPAILYAARDRSPKVVAFLAGLSGTAVDATDATDETALMLVSLHGDLTTMKVLLERGAEVNRKGWTALHYAASNGQVEAIRLLLDAHAYIDAQSPNRTTPLMMAARHEHIAAVRLLVEAGADPTPENEAGFSAADYMARHGQTAEAAWLREQAAAFQQRYGTTDKPRVAEPPSASPVAAEPATTSPVKAPSAPSRLPANSAPPVTSAPPANSAPPASAPPATSAPQRPRLPGMRD